ncbi:MAG: NAD-dependent epimerase/dehydratase family protein [Ilumatobacteraceae bacterium]
MTVSRDNQRLLVVTGVGGFIGSSLAGRLLVDGYRVLGVDDFSSGKRSNVPLGIDLVEANLASTALSDILPSRALAVLHLAGQSSGEISFDDPVGDLEKNAVSTLRLIEYGIGAGVQRFVHASSMSVYGSVSDKPIREDATLRPLSCYGVGKATAEGYLQVFSRRLPYVALRMFNVYGPGQDMSNLRQGMVSIYLAQALATSKIVVKGSMQRYRDFVYIDDVVEAWALALQRDEALNHAINIGTGVRTEVGQLLELITAIVPGTTVEFADNTPGDQFGIYADTTRMTRLLGIATTTTLQDGLQRFVDEVRTA